MSTYNNEPLEDENVLELVWQGPFSLPKDLYTNSRNPIPDEMGVYIWTVPRDSLYFVHYVGAASVLRNRQYEHVIGVLGGGAWIARFTEDKQDNWIPEVPSDLSSWEKAFKRLEWFWNCSKAIEYAREYLMKVRLFVAVTKHSMDAEYLIQKKFKAFVETENDASRYCPDLDMRGSRSSGIFRSVINRLDSIEIIIPGLTDDTDT